MATQKSTAESSTAGTQETSASATSSSVYPRAYGGSPYSSPHLGSSPHLHSDIVESESDSSSRGSSQRVVVKNTFIDVVEAPPAEYGHMRRSVSETDLSNATASFHTQSVSQSVSHSSHSDHDSFKDDSECKSGSPNIDSGSPNIDDKRVSEIVMQIHRETSANIADLQAAAETADLRDIPRHPNTGVLLSVGSIQHLKFLQDGMQVKPHASECSPCLFYFTNTCIRGVLCLYCHFRHKDQKVKLMRPSKKTRQRMKKKADLAVDGSAVLEDGTAEGGRASSSGAGQSACGYTKLRL